MSDIQGERPEQPAGATPAPSSPESIPAQPAASAPVPPVPPVPPLPRPAAPAAPAYGMPVPPAPQGTPYGVPAYGAPVAGQPAAPRPVAGQPQWAAPHSGQAFGLHQTQPTLPLPPAGGSDAAATGTVATASVPRRGGAGRVVGFIVAAALVGGAAGIGGSYLGSQLWSAPIAAGERTPSVVTVNNPDSVNATTAIAAKVLPSVVTISASGQNEGGTGSGVVLTADGYVVTNTHVVTLDGATGDASLRVTTSDGHVYDAKVVGTDPIYDLAVIKLEGASGLTPIEFGDSTKLNVGDQTVAVGAPLGLSNTVTTGIVSALNRSIQIASSAAPEGGDTQDGDNGDGSGPGGPGGQDGPFFFDFGQGQQQQSQANGSISLAVIQTDAAINPGNSGGALVNREGELIGINVAIATAGGTSSGEQSGSIGVGFSIPSNIVKRVSDDIIKDGKATHGLLGATVSPAASQQGSTITGAFIASVTDGGAAVKAGLRQGDVVTEFNGVPITDSIDLTAQVRALAAGSTASLTYVRDGKTYEAQVTLGSLSEG